MSYAPRSHHATENKDPSQEAVGAIASDSLAAESIREGGDFAENENAGILGQKGAGSTFANTDTSNAEELYPARSREARDDRDATFQYTTPHQGEVSGATTAEGYSGASTAGRTGQVSGDGYAGGGSDPGNAGVRPYVETGPTYTGRVTGDIESEGTFKPKGKNLHEGGVPETGTYTGDVGGPHDPGRLAERDFERINEASTGDYPPGQQQKPENVTKNPPKGSSGQFDVLKSESA